MPRTLTVVVPVVVEIDLDTYARAYGFDGADDPDNVNDARGHTAEMIKGAADDQLESVANGSHRIPIEDGLDVLTELNAALKITNARELHARLRLLIARLTTEV